MPLSKYRAKRDFRLTAEPQGTDSIAGRAARDRTYVIHKHQASHLHYDFRLEWNGVLLSWAVPKGPSLDPSVKRMAVAVEDHPLEYGRFEGTIPEGQYGGGTVMVWDRGTWVPQVDDVDAALESGELKFSLKGSKLRGSWVLVRLKPRGKSSRPSWLLIKHRDRYASENDVTTAKPRSVVSKRSMEAIARANGGDVEKAAAADPG